MNWIKEFDEGIGREIEGDIQAAHNEYCISRDKCDCNTRYERLKTAITTQITKEREEEWKRCVDLLDHDHKGHILPQTCIGYGNAQSDLMNNPPAALKTTI